MWVISVTWNTLVFRKNKLQVFVVSANLNKSSSLIHKHGNHGWNNLRRSGTNQQINKHMLVVWGLHGQFDNLYKQLQTTQKIILMAIWKSKRSLAKYWWDRTHVPGITSLGDEIAMLFPLIDLSSTSLGYSLLIPILKKESKCSLMFQQPKSIACMRLIRVQVAVLEELGFGRGRVGLSFVKWRVLTLKKPYPTN